MDRPLVSVVIPAYNAARWLDATLRSAVAQTYRPIEVLVVDDGSTDATAEIASAFGPPVRCIRQTNAGAAAARNRGINDSAGAYVALLDADDLWAPEKLEVQVAVLERDKTIGALQCGATYVDEQMRVLEVLRPVSERTTFWDVLRFRNVVALMSTLVIRRSCIEAAGAQDERFEGKDEWEWGMRLARACGLGGVDGSLVTHRVFASSMSRNVDSHIAPGLLVLDHVFADPAISREVAARRGEVYAAFYTMLAGGYFQARRWPPFLRWSLRAIARDPRQLRYMAELPVRALRRLISRRRARRAAR